jgi:hypothetical protein
MIAAIYARPDPMLTTLEKLAKALKVTAGDLMR